MGLHFGNLYKLRGIVMYRLSPYEQRAFAGLFKQGIPNVFRRTKDQIFYVLPPFVLTYLVYDWGEREYKKATRKNPADFANDK
ncbi:cytochrome b-c1 complex subunit 8-like [Dermacentor silvarum]|uniref:cytochrome b-c1 complex subunit 8-like n=1 Tax=Dermacentor silvarum TaxID=543639 RepID=UPI001897B8DC|nr:cytochrome b-c1 complex subunit 8-like [Dermacentor silvarum]